MFVSFCTFLYVPFMCREGHLQQSFSLLPAFLCRTEYIKHFTCSRINISCPAEVLCLLKMLIFLCCLWWEPRFRCLQYRHLHLIINAAIMLCMLVVFFLDSIWNNAVIHRNWGISHKNEGESNFSRFTILISFDWRDLRMKRKKRIGRTYWWNVVLQHCAKACFTWW